MHAGLSALLCFGAVGRDIAQTAARSGAQTVADYGKLPLRFEANHGQAGASIEFLTHGSGYGLSFSDHEAVLALQKSGTSRADVVRVQMQGSKNTRPVGAAQLPGIVNYIQTSDPATWKTNIPTYAQVRYPGVYPGIDLVYYGNREQLEYDFVVAPHANARKIRLHFEGARQLVLDPGGNLVIEANSGSIAFHKPVLYQQIAGQRREVAGTFTLFADNTVGFQVGPYDHSELLVIDPTLIYSTYLGGTIQDGVTAMAVDSAGEAYVTGSTSAGNNTAPDFPTTPGSYLSSSPVGNYTTTAFVSKLNASGTALLYSTYLAPGAIAAKIALDSSGNAIIVGSTTSKTYPVTAGAFQSTNKAASGSDNAFVTKLNASGSALIFSTFLGGSTSDAATGLALNSAGDIYISGIAYSTDFPVTSGVYQGTSKGSSISYYWNNFLTEMSPTGNALVFSTYLGGSHEYSTPPAAILAVDASGNAYISSTALSTDFPVTSGAFQTTNPDPSYGSITVSKLNPSGTQLLYSTFLDGTGASYDQVRGLAVDGTGNLYLAGTTGQTNFPITSGAFQTTNKSGGGGGTTGFVTKLNPTGTALIYSTYLGGSTAVRGDGFYGLSLDSANNVFVSGQSAATDYPTTSNAYQVTSPVDSFYGNGAVPVVSELNSAGSSLTYSTFFTGEVAGGSAVAIALGPSSSVFFAGYDAPTYLVGVTNNFPITSNAFEPTSSSSNGATGFVAELSFGSAPTTLPTGTSLLSNANPAITGTNLTFSAYVAPNTGSAIPSGNVVFSVDNATVATVALNAKGIAAYSTTTPLALGQHYILASYAGNSTYSASAGGVTENIVPATPTLSPAGGVYTSAQLITLGDATPSVVLYYTLDGSAPTASSTKYTAPLLVSTTVTVSVVAIANGVPSSSVGRATYSFLAAPSVLAAPATAIGANAATLNAVVLSANGMAGSYSFAYGTSSGALTSTTPATSFGGSVLGKLSIASFAATAKLTTLITKTTYYFKVIVTTNAGVSSGQVLSFTTN
jgi:hypothetical protein